MNVRLRRQINRRKSRMQNRIDKEYWDGQSPMISTPPVKYELADRQEAIGAGGIGTIMQLVKQLDLRKNINRAIPLFKINLPYDEADHVFNIALNLLAGGRCLEHLELRRTDEAYLNAVGAQRIPDPTTAGDFCRRFGEVDVIMLMQGFNRVRTKVWKQQPHEFFDTAIIEADGTMVETNGERKEGIGMNHEKKWGVPSADRDARQHARTALHRQSQVAIVRAMNTLRSISTLSIQLCRDAGFRKIVLRGDTDFSLTEHFDRWHEDDVEFVFGVDAMPNLVKTADSLEETAWKPLRRRKPSPPKTARRRRPSQPQARDRH